MREEVGTTVNGGFTFYVQLDGCEQERGPGDLSSDGLCDRGTVEPCSGKGEYLWDLESPWGITRSETSRQEVSVATTSLPRPRPGDYFEG